MKITVLADGSGKIIGFSRVASGRVASGRVMTALDADEGQRLHSVELSPELLQHVGEDSFADQVFQHVVAVKGKTATLVRGKK
jgi:hypothetical protein